MPTGFPPIHPTAAAAQTQIPGGTIAAGRIMHGALCSHSQATSTGFAGLVSCGQRTAARTWYKPAALGWPSPSSSSSAGILITAPKLRQHKTAHVKSGEADDFPKSEDIMVDEETLQSNLDRAIKEEDYARAAKIRDDLRMLHEDAKASLLAANARFYNAFKNGDIAAMYSIWAKGDYVYVVHPSAARISGYDVVMQSWEMVCNADYEFPLSIDLKNIEAHVRGGLGYVTCLEVVKTKGRTWGKQIATNIFVKVNGVWLMCVHHASHMEE